MAPKWTLNGWTKFCGACVVVATGVTVGVCNTGVKDWLGYSGVQTRIGVTEAMASEAKAEASDAHRHAEQNSAEIQVLKAQAEARQKQLDRLEKGQDWIKDNLYDFLKRQPGVSPPPPPQP